MYCVILPTAKVLSKVNIDFLILIYLLIILCNIHIFFGKYTLT